MTGTDDTGAGHDPLTDLFEDLEQQAAGLELVERDAELADRARGEYATVTLDARLHASRAHRVELHLRCGSVVTGDVDHAGRGWVVLREGARAQPVLVPFHALVTASGLSSRAAPEEVRPVQARLGLGSALHRLAEEAPLRLRTSDGSELVVGVQRIGRDFVEGVALSGAAAGRPGGVSSGSACVVPFEAITVVRPERQPSRWSPT